MPHVLDWRAAAREPAQVRPAISALRSGSLIALPTESAYVLAAHPLQPDAVAQLVDCGATEPLTLLLPNTDAAFDWVDLPPAETQRLLRRAWPGPLVLTAPFNPDRLMGRLPAGVVDHLRRDGLLRLQVPAHEAPLALLADMATPLIVVSTGRTLDTALTLAGDRLELVIDDGPVRYEQAPTVIRPSAQGVDVLTEGSLTKDELSRMSSCVIMFVCTGNTCRSPMAEALCKQMLAQRLGCSEAELAQRGYWVLSAGLAASRGDRAAREAIQTMSEYGADLSNHVSRPAVLELVSRADHVVAMTQSHLAALSGHLPSDGPSTRLLRHDGVDLPDPIGGGPEDYRSCARTIHEHLGAFVAEVLGP